MHRFAAAVLVLGLLLGRLPAGEFNKRISIGDAVPAFSKLPGVDGKDYSLETFKDKDVLVLIITGNRCPVSQDYEERIMAFTKKYGGEAGKVGILAVSVEKDDLLSKMKDRAKERGFNYSYALDETQRLGNELGATTTPEFFVFNKERKLVYMGVMDDDQIEPKINYLDLAVEAALKGQKIEKTETRPYGCSIEYKSAASGVELKAVKYDALKAAVRAQRGQVVVVDVWSSTCIPCMKAFPDLLEMQRQHEKEGLVCLSVSIDPPTRREAALKFLEKQNSKIANYLLDEKQEVVQQKFDMTGAPVVFVFDRQGRRAAKFENADPGKAPFDHTDVEKVVQRLLKDR